MEFLIQGIIRCLHFLHLFGTESGRRHLQKMELLPTTLILSKICIGNHESAHYPWACGPPELQFYNSESELIVHDPVTELHACEYSKRVQNPCA
jgi:hypothetical protein